MIMLNIIPCAILSLALSISVTSAFSGCRISSSISSRRSTSTLSSTQVDIDDGVSLHHNRDLLVKTVADVIVIDVPQQQQLLHADNSNNALVVIENTPALPDTKSSLSNKIKKIWNTEKKLKKRYAIVLGRLLILGVSFLPLVRSHQNMHKEEYLIQLLLLGISMQPLKKSATLAKCIKNSETGIEECQLEFEDLEDAFDIDKPKRNQS